MDSAKLAELEAFVKLLKGSPELLRSPPLAFFKNYLESLGATVPDSPVAEVTSEEEEVQEEVVDDLPSEIPPLSLPEDFDLMNPEGDELPPLPMETSRELTDEELEKLGSMKMEMAEAIENGELATALQRASDGLMMGCPTALLFVRRAELLLKLRRPVAAIRDCDEALKINPDNAKAYKTRGKAERFLGEWEAAHQDLETGLRIDYDDDTCDMAKLVASRWSLMDAHRKAVARREEEVSRKLAERERLRRKAKAEKEYGRAHEPRESGCCGGHGPCENGMGGKGTAGGPCGMPGGMGGMPGGMGGMAGGMGGMPGGMGGMPGGMGGMPGGMGGMPGGMGGMPGGMGGMPGFLAGAMSDPEIQGLLKNPKVLAAFGDLVSNPGNISKYASDPEVMAAYNKIFQKFAGGHTGGV